MAFDQRRTLLPSRRLPNVGQGVPNWVQQFLTELKRIVEPPTKFIAIGPNTAGTTWKISHNLNNQNVVVQVRIASTGSMASPTITITDNLTVTITSTGSVAPDSYVAVILG